MLEAGELVGAGAAGRGAGEQAGLHADAAAL